MGRPRPKRTYSPELIENLRFRFEETGEPVRTIAVSVPMGRTTLYALAEELGWTRYVPPPLDLSPAARLAAEAGRLAAEAGRRGLSSRATACNAGGPGPILRSDHEAPGSLGPCLRGDDSNGSADESSPPTPDPSPPLAALAGGGEEYAAPASAAQSEQDADLSNLEPQERRARLSAMARAIDHQLALLRRRQALPQTEHERKEISIEFTKLNAALSQTEQQLQDLDRGRESDSAIGGDTRRMDIDERRLRLARRIREFVASRRSGEDDAAADGHGC